MPLQTQFMTFFVSPFSEPSSHAELNNFLKSHRIINVEKRLIDGERGTGWVFLVEYSDIDGSKAGYTMSSKIDWRDVLTPSQFAVYDLLRKRRKEISDKTKIPLYGILSNEQLALMSQNLTSQFFANLYLSETDHFAVEKLKSAGYVRYMDDILIFADSRAEVNFFYSRLKSFTENNFFLEFKPPVINLCKTGIPFLGHLITPAGISLLGKNRRRKHKKEKQLMNLLSENKITPAQFSCRYAALFTGENFLLPTQSPTR